MVTISSFVLRVGRVSHVVVWHVTTLKAHRKTVGMWGLTEMRSSFDSEDITSAGMGFFSVMSEMKQNPASFAMALSIIWRIQSNIIKYRPRRLNDVGHTRPWI